jgi:LPXTG-motif cell wall-anchored protein
MKKTGIIVLIIGLVFTVITGLSFFTREKVVDIGALEISARKKHSISWSPIVGIIAVALGGGLYLFRKKTFVQHLDIDIKHD